MERIDELEEFLTEIKNDESPESAMASLKVWINCMDGNYSEIPEIEEYISLVNK